MDKKEEKINLKEKKIPVVEETPETWTSSDNYFSLDTAEPSKELLDAIEEGEAILRGEIPSKGYHDVHQMFEDILNED